MQGEYELALSERDAVKRAAAETEAAAELLREAERERRNAGVVSCRVVSLATLAQWITAMLAPHHLCYSHPSTLTLKIC